MSGSDDKGDSGLPISGPDVREASEEDNDVEMDLVPTEKHTRSRSDIPDSMDTTVSGDDNSTGNDNGSASDSVYPTLSSMSTYTARPTPAPSLKPRPALGQPTTRPMTTRLHRLPDS